MSLAGIY